MSVAEVLARVGSAELAEWAAELYVLRPEDEERAMDEAKREAEGEVS